MKTRLALRLASLALAVGTTSPACASTIQFNPAGTGITGALTIDLWDLSPGNSLLMGVSFTSPVGSVGSLLLAANLEATSNTIGSVETRVFANGQTVGGKARFFTIAAAFKEVILSNSGGSFATLIFGPNGGPQNGVFHIYAENSAASDLNGACFVNCSGTNSPILSGTLMNNASFFGNLSANAASGSQPLDQFNTDQYPGRVTISGGGRFGADVQITSVNTGYFPTLSVGSTLHFSMEQTSVFRQANPALCFSLDAITSCNQPGVASIGALNGTGPNVILQTDASLSFTAKN
jgi:hypothetical protein